ncbi:dihydropteroate synthase [Microbacterium resistens]|uniref:Dihydropteroate synthase n=1 Tax=Microbacterium resistens TaxID=156977 RepID=A0ABU1SAD2_9MICO|nr:dihydropteroate synthase [Microbacterium resistens]MDR6866562.1 dihydropteroate synthase [Microbacterium resistens]
MTAIWGIVNATPDSFSDGGRYADPVAAVARGRLLRDQGAAVLDIGGESTRPGAERVDPAEERRRVLPVIEALAAAGIPVSIDTLNASTAVAAVGAGARIVNDVSGGLADPDMLAAVADSGADIALGHWRGPSADMYARAEYSRVGREVAAELRARVEAAAAAGIAPSRVIVDPGVGFAKTAAQNWELLRDLEDVVALGSRVLVGTSRKRFLGTALGDEADESRRDAATAVTSVLAARAGAWAVRVHDVAATRDALAVLTAWDG